MSQEGGPAVPAGAVPAVPVDPVERYNVLLEAYQKMKQRAVAFKAAAQSERAAAAALRDELRAATETNDRLRAANQGLAQRLAAATGGTPDAPPAPEGGFVSGLLGLGRSAAEASKLREETRSMQEELAAKNEQIVVLQLQMTQQHEDHVRALRDADARHDAACAALQAQLDTALAELKTARAETARARDESAAAAAALQEAQAAQHSAEAHAADLAAALAQTAAARDAAQARLRAAVPFDAHADAALAAWDVPLDPATADPAALARTASLRAQCVAYQQLLAAVATATATPTTNEAPQQSAAAPPQTAAPPPPTRQWDAAAESALLDACREHSVAVSDDVRTTDAEREHLRALRAQYEGAVAQAVRAARAADARAGAAQQAAAAARAEAAQERARAEAAEQQGAVVARALDETRDDLADVRAQYEGQLQALTECTAALKDQVAALDVRLTDVQACEVQCATCRAWNTVQYLLSPAGAGGKVCAHGDHPTCTFKR